jgi:hypothetical protein
LRILPSFTCPRKPLITRTSTCRALPSLTCPYRPLTTCTLAYNSLPSLTPIRKALPLLPRTLPSLTPTYRALFSLLRARKALSLARKFSSYPASPRAPFLVCQALPSLTCPGIKANNHRNIRIRLYTSPLASLSARKPASLPVRKPVL